MIFSLLKSKICAKCDTVFIVPMRRNKHNITYLPTYLTYLVNLHTLLTYYLFTTYLHTYLLVPETQPRRAAYLLKDRIGTGILHHLSTPAMRCRFVLRQGESAKHRQNHTYWWPSGSTIQGIAIFGFDLMSRIIRVTSYECHGVSGRSAVCSITCSGWRQIKHESSALPVICDGTW